MYAALICWQGSFPAVVPVAAVPVVDISSAVVELQQHPSCTILCC
jgi:hypothetical protein